MNRLNFLDFYTNKRNDEILGNFQDNVMDLIKKTIKENPEIHIARVLKAIGKKSNMGGKVLGIVESDSDVFRLMNKNYFPKNIEQLSGREFEYDPSYEMSIYNLLMWGKELIKFYGNNLSQYFLEKMKYEHALFAENYNEATQVLDNIEEELGVSLWLYYQRFILSSLSGNKDLKKSVSNIREKFNGNNMISILFAYYEKMADIDIEYEDYTQSIHKMIEKEGKNNLRGRYLGYKLDINGNKSVQDFKSALIIDEQISLIDYYESFIDTMQNLYYQSRMINVIQAICQELYGILKDYRIRNLFIANGGEVEKKEINNFVNEIIEEYTVGNYKILEKKYLKLNVEKCVDFDLYSLFLKANINISIWGVPFGRLWSELYSIYTLTHKIPQSIKIIGGYYKVLYNTSWKYKLYGILVRKLKCLHNENSLYLCVVNDQYLTPLFFQCILEENNQRSYLNLFDEACHNTICLHKYVLGDELQAKEKEIIYPVRFKFYKIKKTMREKNHIECVRLCKEFLEVLSPKSEMMYYQERVRRILFSCLLIKEFWSDAMHLYVESYLMAKELVVRMPLEKLIDGVLKVSEQEENIRCDICTPIILRLFYHEDNREVITAYLNYLESQNCRTIIEYVGKKNKLNIQEVFFLHSVCIESLLMRDYVSCSEIDGDAVRLRKYILRALITLNPSESKKYLEELNTLFKEVQLQERMKYFNHNRVFIDKIKLLEYLERTINKEFSNYSKVREIKLVYEGEEGKGEILEFGYDNTEQFFYEIIEKIKQAYLFDSPYSLEEFLGTRIRHVFCKDSLKKAFEEQTLFTKKLKDTSDEYTVNEYWNNKLDKKDNKLVMSLLSDFSKKVDTKIQEIRDVWMRIKKSKEGNELFDYCDFSECFMNSVELNIVKILDSESQFYKSVISQLDIWTTKILEQIRERIDNELKIYYGQLLVELEKGINEANINITIKRELLRKVEICKVKAIEDIQNFKDVFYMESEQYPDFTMKEVIDFCKEIEKHINANFRLVNLEINNHCQYTYKGNVFPYLVDIVSILIHNAVEHSQFPELDLLNIYVSIYSYDNYPGDFHEKLKDFSIVLNIRNNLHETVDQTALFERTNSILNNMEENTFREKSKLVKGSGLYKIARTLYYNLDGYGAFSYTYEEGWFNLSIAMDLKEYLKGE